MRAMVADDEAHIRELVAMLLTELGAEVVAAARDGQEAVRLFMAERPDVVLMDINMPRKTGVEALREIRAFQPDALVLMMSAQDALSTVEGCLDAGAFDYILKSNSAVEVYRLLGERWGELVRIAAARGTVLARSA